MTEEQKATLLQLKKTFPYRIVYLAISIDGSWRVGTSYTKAKPNNLVRKGYQVWIV